MLNDFSTSDEGLVRALRTLGIGDSSPIVNTFNCNINTCSARYYSRRDPGAYLGVARMMSPTRNASYFGVLRSGSTTAATLPATFAPSTRFALLSSEKSIITQDWQDLVCGNTATVAADSNCLLYDGYATPGVFGSTDFVGPNSGTTSPATLPAEPTMGAVPVLGIAITTMPGGSTAVTSTDVRDGGPSGLLRIEIDIYSAHSLWVGWRGSINLGTDFTGTRSSILVYTSQRMDGEDLWLPGHFRRPSICTAPNFGTFGTGYASVGSGCTLTMGYETKQNVTNAYTENVVIGRCRVVFPHDLMLQYLTVASNQAEDITALISSVIEQTVASKSTSGSTAMQVRPYGQLAKRGLPSQLDESSWGYMGYDLQSEFLDAVETGEVDEMAMDERQKLSERLGYYIASTRLLTPAHLSSLMTLRNHPEVFDNEGSRASLASYLSNLPNTQS